MKFVKALTWTFPLHKLVWRELDSKKAKFAFLWISLGGMVYAAKKGMEFGDAFASSYTEAYNKAVRKSIFPLSVSEEYRDLLTRLNETAP